MRLKPARRWTIQPATCCSCGETLDVARDGATLTAGEAFMPNVPGSTCQRCEPVTDGPKVKGLLAPQADQLLRTAAFEVETPDAAQVFLNHWGWEPTVIAGAAMRLHLDGFDGDAHALLEAAQKGAPDHAAWLKVEQAGLRTLDGSYGKALDLLNATAEADHPCWNLHHGVLAQTLGRKEAALEHWQRQVDVEPDELVGWRTLGWFYAQEQQDFAASEALMRRACARFPRWMEFRAWLGHALHRLDRPSEALAELEASLPLDTDNPELADQIAELVARIKAEQA